MTSFAQSKAYTRFVTEQRPTQLGFYQECGADDSTLNLVKMNPKRFGTFAECWAREHFELHEPSSMQYDAITLGHKIEIKSARRGINGKYFFQHIEPDYDYDIILTMLLEPVGGFVCHVIRKEDVLSYLSVQGRQGYFLYDKDIEEIGRRVETRADLRTFIKNTREKSWILKQ